MEIIRVRVAEPDSGRVALWERHPAHPGGEVWLAGAGEYDVAATPAVAARLRNGTLVQVGAATAPPLGQRATGERPEKDAQVEAEVPAEARERPKGRKDAAEAVRVLPDEEPVEDVSIVTRTTGEGAPASRVQRRKARGGL